MRCCSTARFCWTHTLLAMISSTPALPWVCWDVRCSFLLHHSTSASADEFMLLESPALAGIICLQLLKHLPDFAACCAAAVASACCAFTASRTTVITVMS